MCGGVHLRTFAYFSTVTLPGFISTFYMLCIVKISGCDLAISAGCEASLGINTFSSKSLVLAAVVELAGC